LFGTTLRDLGQYIRPQDLEVEVLDDLNPSLEFKVDQVLDQSSPETVRPIHQTLRRVREGKFRVAFVLCKSVLTDDLPPRLTLLRNEMIDEGKPLRAELRVFSTRGLKSELKNKVISSDYRLLLHHNS
jgi:hypothetical protein